MLDEMEPVKYKNLFERSFINLTDLSYFVPARPVAAAAADANNERKHTTDAGTGYSGCLQKASLMRSTKKIH